MVERRRRRCVAIKRKHLVWIMPNLLLSYSLFSTRSLLKGVYTPMTSSTQQFPSVVVTAPLFANSSSVIIVHPKPNQIRSSNDNNNNNNSRSRTRQVIFYNVYMDVTNVTRGADIIKEQTKQIARILHAQHRTSHVRMYYNMIGYNYSENFCPFSLACIFLNYYEKAHEEVTLQKLFEHCGQHPHDEVYYVHNKGSFSLNDYNDQKRHKFTGYLFEDGEKWLDSKKHCNVASFGWEPLPHWHYRGNFWLAKCSYVRKLVPPKDFNNVRANMFRRLLQRNESSPQKQEYLACLRSYFNESIDDIYQQSEEIQHQIGVGRYNNEVWITIHPDVVPCDQMETIFTSKITDKYWFRVGPYAGNEWFRLRGRLYEFYQLYGKVPPNASFFWRYYEPAQEPTTPDLVDERFGIKQIIIIHYRSSEKGMTVVEIRVYAGHVVVQVGLQLVMIQFHYLFKRTSTLLLPFQRL